MFMVVIPFFKIVDNVTFKNSAVAIIEFDSQPSWILTDFFKEQAISQVIY